MMSDRLNVLVLQKVLAQIPWGRVVTYKQVAVFLGNGKASRVVGRLCGENLEPDQYPCFKVVCSDGTVGGFAFGVEDKIRRLKEEGIEVENGTSASLSGARIVGFESRKYCF
jgi:deoxyribonuclease V